MDRLITRFRQSGIMFLIGFILILYIALGILYLQQTTKQNDFKEQINKINLVLVKPLPSDENLRAEYKRVTESISSITVNSALAKIVDIASSSGIDVAPDSGKLHIAPAQVSKKKIDTGNYTILSFTDITVKGTRDNIMALISNIDKGETLETMVLKRAEIGIVEYKYEGDDGKRRAEYHEVSSAIKAMMKDNDLTEIPHPVEFTRGVATNIMGYATEVVVQEEEEEETVESEVTAEMAAGFPDITTTVEEKNYTGEGTPRGGYVLYNHDKINPKDTTLFTTESYFKNLTTVYYYTCDSAGIIRQFNGPDLAAATEFEDFALTWSETVVHLDVDIYTKLTDTRP